MEYFSLTSYGIIVSTVILCNHKPVYWKTVVFCVNKKKYFPLEWNSVEWVLFHILFGYRMHTNVCIRKLEMNRSSVADWSLFFISIRTWSLFSTFLELYYKWKLYIILLNHMICSVLYHRLHTVCCILYSYNILYII